MTKQGHTLVAASLLRRIKFQQDKLNTAPSQIKRQHANSMIRVLEAEYHWHMDNYSMLVKPGKENKCG